MLGFLELPDDERPPEEYWHSSDAINEWFEAVKQKRADKYSGIEAVPDPGEDDDAEMTGNSLARDLLNK